MPYTRRVCEWAIAVTSGVLVQFVKFYLDRIDSAHLIGQGAHNTLDPANMYDYLWRSAERRGANSVDAPRASAGRERKRPPPSRAVDYTLSGAYARNAP